MPFSTAPTSPDGITCYTVIDPVRLGEVDSRVIAEGCHQGSRIPPMLPTAPTPGARTTAAAAAEPILEVYALANYGGASRIIYGSAGPCDNRGYRVSDLSTQNNQLRGIRSYRTYNNCSHQAVHNQTNFAGTPIHHAGYQRANLPAGYNDAVRSMRLAAVPCTYYNETNASVCGVIRDKYTALGGPNGALGYPTSNELTNPDRVGRRNTFQGNASIYWTPATGAHDVRGALRDAWARNGWETGPLGYPLSDQLGLVDGQGLTNRFFKNNTYAAGTQTRNTGAVYWSPATNAYATWGAIWDKYAALGGAISVFGYPTSDELTNAGNTGKRNTFSNNGAIYWSARHGAFGVHGEAYTAWGKIGYESGRTGYPTADAVTNRDGVGIRQTFASGRIMYWHPDSGAHDINAGTDRVWSDEGREAGFAGYPISSEFANPGGQGMRTDFQNSFIITDWLVAGGQAATQGQPTEDSQSSALAQEPLYKCDSFPDRPHFSNETRANTVLLKNRVYCTGPTPMTIRVLGSLNSRPGASPPAAPPPGPGRQRVQSDETRDVPGNGQRQTFYTPQIGGPQVLGTEWYSGVVVGEVIAPQTSPLSFGESGDRYVTTP